MMQKKNNPSRRNFIQKAVLAPLALSLPTIAKSAESGPVGDDCFETTRDLYGQGPFYTANAPTIENNLLALEDEPGARLVISGVVHTLDCAELIPGTLIDIWHADHEGAYDTEGFHLRGKTTSNAQGFYLFETILPGKYLNGSTYRPSHIHVKITPPGFPTLTTQLYFEGDKDIPADAAASLTSGQFDASHRIIALADNGGGTLEGTWDIILDGDGITGVTDLHLDKGIIYSASPNPFSEYLDVFYGVFQPARVRIEAFDQRGVMVARLIDQELSPQKYTASWYEAQHFPPGHYWVTIKINELQVHYLKVVKV